MKVSGRWALASLPVLVAIVIVGVVAGRYVLSDGSNTQPVPSQQADQILDQAPADNTNPLNELYPLANFPPLPSEAQLVSSSQLIVEGRLTKAIGDEFISSVGPNAVPGHGVLTTKYALLVENYVKGTSPAYGDKLVVQVLADYTPDLPLNERLLLFLVPYREGTFQAGALTVLREDDSRVVDALGGELTRAGGMTLDGYTEHLAALVERQASEGAEAGLAVPLVLVGETITPAHYLGLQNTKGISVAAPGKPSRDLSTTDVSALVDMASHPFLIEAVADVDSAGSIEILVSLDDGHVWKFGYNPDTGALVYAAAGLQITIPESARTIISKALTEAS